MYKVLMWSEIAKIHERLRVDLITGTTECMNGFPTKPARLIPSYGAIGVCDHECQGEEGGRR